MGFNIKPMRFAFHGVCWSEANISEISFVDGGILLKRRSLDLKRYGMFL